MKQVLHPARYLTHRKEQHRMKVKLGHHSIELNRVWRVTRIGERTARIRFVTGESIQVHCCVESPSPGWFSYPGTVEELKAFIEKNKG